MFLTKIAVFLANFMRFDSFFRINFAAEIK